MREVIRPLISVVILMSLIAAVALGHGGEAHETSGNWARWEFDPLIVAVLLIGGTIYAQGIRRLWGNAGVGRGIIAAAR